MCVLSNSFWLFFFFLSFKKFPRRNGFVSWIILFVGFFFCIRLRYFVQQNFYSWLWLFLTVSNQKSEQEAKKTEKIGKVSVYLDCCNLAELPLGIRWWRPSLFCYACARIVISKTMTHAFRLINRFSFCRTKQS